MPTYPGSRQWLYYTGNDSYASVKLPVEHSEEVVKMIMVVVKFMMVMK